MVSGMSHGPDDEGRGASSFPHAPSGAGTPLGGTPPPSSGAHSASTSGGSAGSPYSRSDQHGPSTAAGTGPPPAAAAATASTPASDGTTFLRLNNLDIKGDDAPSSQAPVRFVKPTLLALPDRVTPSVVFYCARCSKLFLPSAEAFADCS
jgi:transcription factor Dp-1